MTNVNLSKWEKIEDEISFEVPIKTPIKNENIVPKYVPPDELSPTTSPPEDITVTKLPTKPSKKTDEISKLASDLGEH